MDIILNIDWGGPAGPKQRVPASSSRNFRYSRPAISDFFPKTLVRDFVRDCGFAGSTKNSGTGLPRILMPYVAVVSWLAEVSGNASFPGTFARDRCTGERRPRHRVCNWGLGDDPSQPPLFLQFWWTGNLENQVEKRNPAKHGYHNEHEGGGSLSRGVN